MTILRKTTTGVGNGSVNTTGYSHATISISNGSAWVGYGTFSQIISGDKNSLIIPAGFNTLNITGAPGVKWEVKLQNSTPSVNQQELKIFYNEAGKAIISGDDDVSFIGEPTANSMDVANLQPTAANLAELFQKAISTKTVVDAARYCKLKAAFLTRYGV